jgi:hypothetical protein
MVDGRVNWIGKVFGFKQKLSMNDDQWLRVSKFGEVSVHQKEISNGKW